MRNQYTPVYEIVAQIPFGRVTTYGTIARVVPVPRGARGVGWALAQTPATQLIPWWRVVSATGRITSPNAYEQYDRLLAENVPMLAELHVNLSAVLWHPVPQ
ncbi:MAG: MGMT family protein [Chloroflexota bacterium]|jgi:methylated-DNA-protein-cysteine methyltransferase-like protein